jgi:hypothetical protein
LAGITGQSAGVNETLCQRIQLSLGIVMLMPRDFLKMSLWSCLEIKISFYKN